MKGEAGGGRGERVKEMGVKGQKGGGERGRVTLNCKTHNLKNILCITYEVKSDLIKSQKK